MPRPGGVRMASPQSDRLVSYTQSSFTVSPKGCQCGARLSGQEVQGPFPQCINLDQMSSSRPEHGIDENVFNCGGISAELTDRDR